MSTLFFINNLHFSIEVFGALVFFILAWLAFDAYLIRKDSLTLARCLGFVLLTVWQLAFAFNPTSDPYQYIWHIVVSVGIILIVAGLIRESFFQNLKLNGVFILPVFRDYFVFFHGFISLGFFIVSLLSFRQYKNQHNRSIFSYASGFLFLSGGTLVATFYDPTSSVVLFGLGHALEIAGFLDVFDDL